MAEEKERNSKDIPEVVGLGEEETGEQVAEKSRFPAKLKKYVLPAAIALASFVLAISVAVFIAQTKHDAGEEITMEEEVAAGDSDDAENEVTKLLTESGKAKKTTPDGGGIDTAAIMQELAFLDYVPGMEEKEKKQKKSTGAETEDGVIDYAVTPGVMTAKDSVDTLNWLAREMAKLTKAKAADVKMKKELKALEYKIDQALIKIEQAESSQVINLARLYDGMRPEEVGKLFENLDDKAVMAILPRMKPGNAAKILAIMPPKRAAKISTKMITILEQ